jgi:hypothetical protein
LIKHGTEKLFETLCDMFEKCINGGNIPDNWKIAYLTPVYKNAKVMTVTLIVVNQ